MLLNKKNTSDKAKKLAKVNLRKKMVYGRKKSLYGRMKTELR